MADGPHTDYVVAELGDRWRGLVSRRVGYRMSSYEPGEHVGMPGTSLTCILSFDEPLTMTTLPDPTQAPTSLWTLIGGVHDAPAVIAHGGDQHGVQLDLTPMGVRALFGLPVGAIGSSVVSLDEVMGADAEELWQRCGAATGWAERFEVLDEVLLRCRARHAQRPDAVVRTELQWAWNQIVGSGGAVRVEHLADELGWSRRHLSGRFRAEFGVTPSTARRLARFDVAVTLLRDEHPRGLADVAASAGYADQAHLSREFRRFAGRSVTKWWADEQFPFVHDGEHAAV